LVEGEGEGHSIFAENQASFICHQREACNCCNCLDMMFTFMVLFGFGIIDSSCCGIEDEK